MGEWVGWGGLLINEEWVDPSADCDYTPKFVAPLMLKVKSVYFLIEPTRFQTNVLS